MRKHCTTVFVTEARDVNPFIRRPKTVFCLSRWRAASYLNGTSKTSVYAVGDDPIGLVRWQSFQRKEDCGSPETFRPPHPQLTPGLS
jgi:hypothetical protein